MALCVDTKQFDCYHSTKAYSPQNLDKTTFNPKVNIFLFQVLFTTTSFSSVLSCEDPLISSLHRSANM